MSRVGNRCADADSWWSSAITFVQCLLGGPLTRNKVSTGAYWPYNLSFWEPPLRRAVALCAAAGRWHNRKKVLEIITISNEGFINTIITHLGMVGGASKKLICVSSKNILGVIWQYLVSDLQFIEEVHWFMDEILKFNRHLL